MHTSHRRPSTARRSLQFDRFSHALSLMRVLLAQEANRLLLESLQRDLSEAAAAAFPSADVLRAAVTPPNAVGITPPSAAAAAAGAGEAAVTSRQPSALPSANADAGVAGTTSAAGEATGTGEGACDSAEDETVESDEEGSVALSAGETAAGLLAAEEVAQQPQKVPRQTDAPPVP